MIQNKMYVCIILCSNEITLASYLESMACFEMHSKISLNFEIADYRPTDFGKLKVNLYSNCNYSKVAVNSLKQFTE